MIGHWRSGTTLLHELLVLDPRHTFPDTYACFAPNHFLVSGWWMKPCLQISVAGAAADGQHGGRLGPSAGRRVRPVQHGRSLAVSDQRLSEPSAAVSGVSRPARRAGAGAGSLEAGVSLVPQVRDAAKPEADRAEIAAAHLPHPHAAGDVPQGEVRPHRPRPVRHLSLDGQSLEAAVSRSRACKCRRTRAWRSTFSRPSRGCTRRSSATAN